jgi:hypothetical protein
MASVTIIPGRNGTDKPFGETTVQSASWRIARPPYTTDGNWENDLAVIDNVPLEAPNGQWFRFLNATPSDRMPIVVCGYAKRSVTVPQLTQAIDGDKQHLHGWLCHQPEQPRGDRVPAAHAQGQQRLAGLPPGPQQRHPAGAGVRGARHRRAGGGGPQPRLLHHAQQDRLDRRPRDRLLAAAAARGGPGAPALAAAAGDPRARRRRRAPPPRGPRR